MKLLSGRSKRDKIGCGCFSLIVGVFILAFIAGNLNKSNPSKNLVDDPQPVAQHQSAAPKITMAKYDQIRTGMSYDEVVSILGMQGRELSRNELAGVTTVMYQWGTIANMNAMFQNDKLISKAQFGLE